MVSRTVLVAAVLASLLGPRPPDPGPAQDPNLLRQIVRAEGRVSVIFGFHPRQGSQIEGGREEIEDIQDHFLNLMGIPQRDRRVTRFVDIPYLAFEVDERGLEQALDLNVSRSLFAAYGVRLGVGLDLPLRPVNCTAPAASVASAVPMNEVLDIVEVTPLHDMGYRGEEQYIVVVDTGVEPDYHFLEGAVLWGSDQSEGVIDCELGEVIEADPKYGSPLEVPKGTAHGTLVAAVAAGEAEGTPGVAPGAQIISIRVENEEGKVLTSNVAAALQEVLCKWSEVARIAAVNISLGEGDHAASCDGGSTEAIMMMLEIVEKLDVIAIPVVVGAGNWSPPEEIAFPACLSKTVSVCATQNDGESKYINSKWTTLADIAAPTGYISIPGTSPGLEVWIGKGTSISAPFVSGAIALLRQAYPESPPSVVVKVLAENGHEVTSGGVTLECIRVHTAFKILEELYGPPVPPSTGPEVEVEMDEEGPIEVLEDGDG